MEWVELHVLQCMEQYNVRLKNMPLKYINMYVCRTECIRTFLFENMTKQIKLLLHFATPPHTKLTIFPEAQTLIVCTDVQFIFPSVLWLLSAQSNSSTYPHSLEVAQRRAKCKDRSWLLLRNGNILEIEPIGIASQKCFFLPQYVLKHSKNIPLLSNIHSDKMLSP